MVFKCILKVYLKNTDNTNLVYMRFKFHYELIKDIIKFNSVEEYWLFLINSIRRVIYLTD